jgi:hypothetical protein
MPVRGPLLGHNENVVHGGRTFHLQTEDLGPRRSAVTTHLFADGGRIVHSLRTSYAELEDDERLVARIRELMRGQHAGVIDELLRGGFDGAVSGDTVDQAASRGGPRSVVPAARQTVGPGMFVAEREASEPSEPPAPSVADTVRHGGSALEHPPSGPLPLLQRPRFGASYADAPRLDEQIAAFFARRG